MNRYYKDSDDWYYCVTFEEKVPCSMRMFMPDSGINDQVRASKNTAIQIPPTHSEITYEEFERGFARFVEFNCKAMGMKVGPGIGSSESFLFAKQYDYVKGRSLNERIKFIRQIIKTLVLPLVVMIDTKFVDSQLIKKGRESDFLAPMVK